MPPSNPQDPRADLKARYPAFAGTIDTIPPEVSPDEIEGVLHAAVRKAVGGRTPAENVARAQKVLGAGVTAPPAPIPGDTSVDVPGYWKNKLFGPDLNLSQGQSTQTQPNIQRAALSLQADAGKPGPRQDTLQAINAALPESGPGHYDLAQYGSNLPAKEAVTGSLREFNNSRRAAFEQRSAYEPSVVGRQQERANFHANMVHDTIIAQGLLGGWAGTPDSLVKDGLVTDEELGHYGQSIGGRSNLGNAAAAFGMTQGPQLAMGMLAGGAPEEMPLAMKLAHGAGIGDIFGQGQYASSPDQSAINTLFGAGLGAGMAGAAALPHEIGSRLPLEVPSDLGLGSDAALRGFTGLSDRQRPIQEPPSGVVTDPAKLAAFEKPLPEPPVPEPYKAPAEPASAPVKKGGRVPMTLDQMRGQSADLGTIDQQRIDTNAERRLANQGRAKAYDMVGKKKLPTPDTAEMNDDIPGYIDVGKAGDLNTQDIPEPPPIPTEDFPVTPPANRRLIGARIRSGDMPGTEGGVTTGPLRGLQGTLPFGDLSAPEVPPPSREGVTPRENVASSSPVNPNIDSRNTGGQDLVKIINDLLQRSQEQSGRLGAIPQEPPIGDADHQMVLKFMQDLGVIPKEPPAGEGSGAYTRGGLRDSGPIGDPNMGPRGLGQRGTGNAFSATNSPKDVPKEQSLVPFYELNDLPLSDNYRPDVGDKNYDSRQAMARNDRTKLGENRFRRELAQYPNEGGPGIPPIEEAAQQYNPDMARAIQQRDPFEKANLFNTDKNALGDPIVGGPEFADSNGNPLPPSRAQANLKDFLTDEGGAINNGRAVDLTKALVQHIADKAKVNAQALAGFMKKLDPREIAETLMYHPFAPDDFMEQVDLVKGDASKLITRARETVMDGGKVDSQEIGRGVGSIKDGFFKHVADHLDEINAAFDKSAGKRRVTLGDAKYGQLAGKEPHPDLKRVLDEFVRLDTEAKAVGGIVGKAVRFGKGNVTAMSLRGHLRQVEENLFTGMMAGHAAPANAEVIFDALKALRQGMKNPAVEAATGRNFMNGLHGSEFNNVQADLDRVMAAFDKSKPTTFLQDITRIQEKLGKTYDLWDNLNKLSYFMRATGWTSEGKLAPDVAGKARTFLGLPKYGLEKPWLENGPGGWKVNANPLAREIMPEGKAAQMVDKMFVNFMKKSPALAEISKNDLRALVVSRFVTARLKSLGNWYNYFKYNPTRAVGMIAALYAGEQASKKAFKGALPSYQQVGSGKLPARVGQNAVDVSAPLTNYDTYVLIRNLVESMKSPSPEGRGNDAGQLLGKYLATTLASGPLSNINPYQPARFTDQSKTFTQRALEGTSNALIPPGRDISSAVAASKNPALGPAYALPAMAGFTPAMAGTRGKQAMLAEYNAKKGELRDSLIKATSDLRKRVENDPGSKDAAWAEFKQRLTLIAQKRAQLAKDLGQ